MWRDYLRNELSYSEDRVFDSSFNLFFRNSGQNSSGYKGTEYLYTGKDNELEALDLI